MDQVSPFTADYCLVHMGFLPIAFAYAGCIGMKSNRLVALLGWGLFGYWVSDAYSKFGSDQATAGLLVGMFVATVLMAAASIAINVVILDFRNL